MSELFSIDRVYPEGFSYFADFLSEGEEAKLLSAILTVDLHPLIFQGFEAKRKVESFGYDYHFDKRLVTKGKEIPEEFIFVIDKVAEFLGMLRDDFAEMLVTEYPPESVINWHRDGPPFDIIVGISLLSDCTFRLRPYDKGIRKRGSTLSFPVQRRSLYILRGESRNEWEHSIAPVQEQRYSITLRTLENSSHGGHIQY
jgi:alkylated DNA repair dioxygenase AlkB